MNKQKETEEMERHIQKVFDIIKEKFNDIPSACTFADNLYLHDYRKADEVRKEAAKEILQNLYDEAAKYNDETMSLNTYEIKQMAKQYGVELNE